MDRLVMQAGRALVRAMAGDDWHQASAAVTGLWSLAYPASQAHGVQSELDELREQVTQARRADDADSEQALEGYWQVKLQQLLYADPAIASRLQYVLDHVLTPALLSRLGKTSQDEQAGAADATAVRTAVIGQAAAGLTAAAAIIYGSGALTIALRLYFTHLSWEAVLGQLPHDLILTTGFGEIILPAMIIGLLGAVLLNYLVNGGHGKLMSRRLQHYLAAPPSVGHFAVWLLASAFFGVLETIVSLYFYISHARTYFSPEVVIPPFDAMATASVLSAIAVGIALILLPSPTIDGLNHGLSAPRRDEPGANGAGRCEVTSRLKDRMQPVRDRMQQLRDWSGWPSAKPPVNGPQAGRARRASRIITRGAVRRVLARPARQPAKPKHSSLGTAAWLARVGALVGFAVIPGIATFNAVTLFPDTTACSTEFSKGYLAGTLIATNAGWAYTVEYKRSQPGQDYIAMIPLSSLRLEAIGSAGTCAALAQAPAVTTNAASGVTSSGATLNGSVNPGGQGSTYQFDYGTTTSYGSLVPSPAGYAGPGTNVVNESASMTGLRPDTTYHYRIEATNATGTIYGSDQTFATAPRH
jgi:hypothetical protein